VHVAGRSQKVVEFGDGVITGRGTFQKFYDQGELRALLEGAAGVRRRPGGARHLLRFQG
jgi:hypothetical protein